MRQYEAVIKAMHDLGGMTTLSQLNQAVFRLEGVNGKQRLRLQV